MKLIDLAGFADFPRHKTPFEEWYASHTKFLTDSECTKFLPRSTFKCLHIIGDVVKGLFVHCEDCNFWLVDSGVI